MELVLAMGVLAFGMFGLSGFLLVLERGEAEQALATRALFCAQQKMEELRHQSLHQGLSPLESMETLEAAPYRGMVRRSVLQSSPLGQELLRVRVECSSTYKGDHVSKGIQTLILSSG